jgi:hypothetical protein
MSNVSHLVRNFMKHLIATLALGLSSLASAEPPQPNEALRQITAADQQDRSGPASSFAGSRVSPRDAERRKQVMEIMAKGEIRAAEDFFNAVLVFQHGATTDDIRLAYALVTIASAMRPERLGPKAAACASWDRLLVQMGRPQWYGTQYTKSSSTGKFELSPIDETAVTDEERMSLGLPTLRQARENAAQFN